MNKSAIEVEATVLTSAHALIDKLNNLMREYDYTNPNNREGVIELRDKMLKAIHGAAKELENL